MRGIRLRDGDQVVAAVSNVDGDEVLLVTSAGYGKRTAIGEFRRQTRGGIGVKAFKLTRIRGNLVGGRAVTKDDDVFLISSAGIGIRTPWPRSAVRSGIRPGPGDPCRRWQRAVGAGHRLRRGRVREPSANSCRWD